MLDLNLTLGTYAASQSVWKPTSLFKGDEVGVWYDPSDIGTKFGPELVTNGTFDTDISGWSTIDSSSLIQINGRARAEITNAQAGLSRSFSTDIGKTYIAKVDIFSGTAPNDYRLRVGTTINGLDNGNLVLGSNGSFTLSFKATASTTYITSLVVGSAGQYAEWDNFSVKEVITTNTKLFQDAAGTTPVTDVEQPVGLMLDKSQGLKIGPELITNGTFDTDTDWTKGAGVTISGGELTADTTTVGIVATDTGGFISSPGTLYKVTFTVTDVVQASSGVSVVVGNSYTAAYTTTGTFTEYLVAANASSTFIAKRGLAAWSGSIDNVSVKEIAGHHATQTTAAARPVLSSRYNLLEKTEQFDDAYWAKAVGGTGSVPIVTNNADASPIGDNTASRVQMDLNGGISSSDISWIQTASNITTNNLSNRALSIFVKSFDGNNYDISFGTSQTPTTLQKVTVTPEWQEINIVHDPGSSVANFVFGLRNAAGVTGVSDTADILVWGASLTEAQYSNLPYQRVNTSADYDSDFNKFPPYLRFDGIDDYMVVNGLTSGVTPITAHFGYVSSVRGTGDYLIDIETGQTILAANGSVSDNVGFFDGAWTQALYDPLSLTVATFDLNAVSGRIAVNSNTLLDVASSYTEKSIGGRINLGGNYQNTGARFTGNLYQAILRTATSSDADITRAERFVAKKTGVTL